METLRDMELPESVLGWHGQHSLLWMAVNAQRFREKVGRGLAVVALSQLARWRGRDTSPVVALAGMSEDRLLTLGEMYCEMKLVPLTQRLLEEIGPLSKVGSPALEDEGAHDEGADALRNRPEDMGEGISYGHPRGIAAHAGPVQPSRGLQGVCVHTSLPHPVALPLARHLGAAAVRCPVLEVQHGRCTGRVRPPRVYLQASFWMPFAGQVPPGDGDAAVPASCGAVAFEAEATSDAWRADGDGPALGRAGEASLATGAGNACCDASIRERRTQPGAVQVDAVQAGVVQGGAVQMGAVQAGATQTTGPDARPSERIAMEATG